MTNQQDPVDPMSQETRALDGHKEAGSSTSSTGLFGRKYRLTKKLGEGGMGAVYAAEDVKLGRKVAIKVLLAAISGSEEFKARFMREARSQAQLNHANIVTLYDSDLTTEGQPYMVMEFVDGRPMDEIIAEDKAFSLERTLNLFSQICAGVSIAHKSNIVHRDLKPANIIITRDGTGAEHVKILDLGLAKLVENASSNQTLSGRTVGATQAGMVLGTPQYMSPEQATGGSVDERTDIYALGMILCEMLTGSLPFKASSAMQWIARQIADAPTKPSKLRPDLKLPKEVDDVFLKAVAKEKTERYETIGQMLDDLKNALRNVIDVDGAIAGRKSGLSTGAAIVLAVLVVGLLSAGGIILNKRIQAENHRKLFTEKIQEGDNYLATLFKSKDDTTTSLFELNVNLIDTMAKDYSDAETYIGDDVERNDRYQTRQKMCDYLKDVASRLKENPTVETVALLEGMKSNYEPLKSNAVFDDYLIKLKDGAIKIQQQKLEQQRRDSLILDKNVFDAIIQSLSAPGDELPPEIARFDDTVGKNAARLLEISPIEKANHAKLVHEFVLAYRKMLLYRSLNRWYDVLDSLDDLKSSHPWMTDDANPERKTQLTAAFEKKTPLIIYGMTARREILSKAIESASHAAADDLPETGKRSTFFVVLCKGVADSAWFIKERIGDRTVSPMDDELINFYDKLHEGRIDSADETFALIRPGSRLYQTMPNKSAQDAELIAALETCLTRYYFTVWLQLAERRRGNAKEATVEATAKDGAEKAQTMFDVILKNDSAPKAVRDRANFGKWRAGLILVGDFDTDKMLETFDNNHKDAISAFEKTLQSPLSTPEDWKKTVDGWRLVDDIASQLKQRNLPDFLDKSTLDDPKRYIVITERLQQFDDSFKKTLRAHNDALSQPSALPEALFQWVELSRQKTDIEKLVSTNNLTRAAWHSYAFDNTDKKQAETLEQMRHFFKVLYDEGRKLEDASSFGSAREKYLAAQRLFSDERFKSLNLPGAIPVEYPGLPSMIAACDEKELDRVGLKNYDEGYRNLKTLMAKGGYADAKLQLDALLKLIETIRALNPDRLPQTASELPDIEKYIKNGLDIKTSIADARSASVKEEWTNQFELLTRASQLLDAMPTIYRSNEEVAEIKHNLEMVQKHIIGQIAEQLNRAETAGKVRDFASVQQILNRVQKWIDLLPADRRPVNVEKINELKRRADNYTTPPVLKFADGISVTFVYVESPAGSFFMSKYEITNAQYDALMPGRTPSEDEASNHPVVKVNVSEVQGLADAMTARFADAIPSGMRVALPTEQQWIDAASYVPEHAVIVNHESGEIQIRPETRRDYPWPKSIVLDAEFKMSNGKYITNTSCYASSTGSDRVVMERDGYYKTAPVDSFPNDVSFFGVVGLGGNVCEWVDAPRDSRDRLQVRGGSWRHPQLSSKANLDSRTESAFMQYAFSDDRKDWLGVRLVIVEMPK